MIAGAAIWAPMTAMILVGPEAYRKMIALVSLIYPVAYLCLSWLVTFRLQFVTGDRAGGARAAE